MKRYTVRDLHEDVQRYNRYMAASGSNYFYVAADRYGYATADLYFVDDEGNGRRYRMLKRGAPQTCMVAVECHHYNHSGMVCHMTRPTRIMAKIVLGQLIDFDDDFHILDSTAVEALATWAKLTRYRKSRNANGSTARYFFNHLAKKV